MTTRVIVSESFLEALSSTGRSPEIPASDDLYGWLAGSWEMDTSIHVGGEVRQGKGEVHAAWVLDGRAVQDVWITPKRCDRNPVSPDAYNFYGTTMRVYDGATRTWRVNWFNPVTGARDELVGRGDGKEIVQEGKSRDGALIRWSFTDITRDSFRWLGERSDEGIWRVQAEYRARRIVAPEIRTIL